MEAKNNWLKKAIAQGFMMLAALKPQRPPCLGGFDGSRRTLVGHTERPVVATGTGRNQDTGSL